MTFTPSNSTSADKLVPTMIYTSQQIVWGQLSTKPAIRVSSWLQSDMAPDYFYLTDTQTLLLSPGNMIAPIKSNLIHLNTGQVLAYHILPPSNEAPYYDPNEPNRKMAPVTAAIGWCQFDCRVRLAEQSDLQTFLSAQKGDFLPIYDLEMKSPVMPSLKGIKAPFALVRQNAVSFYEK
jgi:hypothetical protein